MDLIARLGEIRRYESMLGRKLGPFALVNDVERGIQESWSQTIKEVLESSKTMHDGSGTTIEAASAEHAIVVLKFIQFSSSFSKKGAEGLGSLPGPILFRGMRDDSWSMVSSLARVSAHEQDGAAHLAEAFARLTRDIGHRMIQVQLPPSTYQAVAQHYGFATPLLDFTPDPEVAVFFACKEGSATRGVVYFNHVGSLLEHGCRVLLPPPLYERLVLQRGVFIDAADVVPKDHFHRVVFPSGRAVTVFRAGRGVDLLSEPTWIARGRAFIEAWAPGKDMDSFPDLHAEWFRQDRDFHLSDGAPKFYPMMEYARWMDHFEDMRYWLASIMSDDEEGFRAHLLQAIERDNPELASLHHELMTAMDTHGWRTGPRSGPSDDRGLATPSAAPRTPTPAG